MPFGRETHSGKVSAKQFAETDAWLLVSGFKASIGKSSARGRGEAWRGNEQTSLLHSHIGPSALPDQSYRWQGLEAGTHRVQGAVQTHRRRWEGNIMGAGQMSSTKGGLGVQAKESARRQPQDSSCLENRGRSKTSSPPMHHFVPYVLADMHVYDLINTSTSTKYAIYIYVYSMIDSIVHTCMWKFKKCSGRLIFASWKEEIEMSGRWIKGI